MAAAFALATNLAAGKPRVLYGVSMGSDGVSQVLSLRLAREGAAVGAGA